uniref:Uncharacterized protein n=1 Tax=Coccidioides posadasii RMSCC 3488 TaxID=454284 RepID=A0A0J6FKM9_COCPO|nr:hypothetical protein CPAG_05720 [Coccidioides posadasii RMSCC 3488]
MPEELPGASSQSPPRASQGEQTKHRGPLSSFKLQRQNRPGVWQSLVRVKSAAVPTDDNVRGCEPLPSPSPITVAQTACMVLRSENAGTGTSGPSPPMSTRPGIQNLAQSAFDHAGPRAFKGYGEPGADSAASM